MEKNNQFLQRVNKIYINGKKKVYLVSHLIFRIGFVCLVAEKLNEKRGEEKAKLSMLRKK